MKLKTICPFLLAVATGFFLGKFMFNQYDTQISIKSVFNNKSSKVYLIQQGVYSSKDSMEKNNINLESYIYEEKENKYYVYIGITSLQDNASKLKDYFESKGYNIYVKEITLDNGSFLSSLEQYDDLLLQTNDDKAIQEICSQVLFKYKELIQISEN